MHDPMVVIFDIKRPWPQSTSSDFSKGKRWARSGPYVTLAGRNFYFPSLLTVWHVEPDGRDSGEVCKGMRGSDLTWRNLKFTARHWRHLHFTLSPWQHFRHRFARCAECGRRMNKAARHGYMSSDATYHSECMSLRHYRSKTEDLQAYIDGRADRNQVWRVEYDREGRITRAAEDVLKESGVI